MLHSYGFRRKKMPSSYLLLLLAAVVRTCEMSGINGFLAGYINAVTTKSEAIVMIVGVFNKSTVDCTSNTIGSVVIENANVTCKGGSCPSSVNFTCTGFSDEDGLTFANAEYSIPSTNGTEFLFESSSTAVDALNKNEKNGRKIYAKIGPDTKFSAFGGPMVLNYNIPCKLKIKIPVDDFEDKMVTCEFDTENCDFCKAIPGLELDTQTCEFKNLNVFDSIPYGHYVIVMKLKRNGTESVQMPYHMLLRTYKAPGYCPVLPEFIIPTPIDGTCFQIFPGEVFSVKAVAFIRVPGDEIKEIRATKFPGMTQTPLKKDRSRFISEFSFNVSAVDGVHFTGARMLCLTAAGPAGIDSDTLCFRIILVLDSNRKYIELTPRYPMPAIVGQDINIVFVARTKVYQSFFLVDVKIIRASDGLVVKAYDTTTIPLTFSENTLSFKIIDGTLTEGTYYMTLGRNAVRLRERYCKLFSLEYNDPRVTFTVAQPLKFSFLSNFTESGSNATISWTLNKDDVHSICAVENPNNQTTIRNCSKEWTGSDLINGDYKLTVTSTDKDGLTVSSSYIWTVDSESPNITCHKLPPPITKNTSVEVMCTCNENCSATCRVVKKTQPLGLFTSCSNLTEELISHSTTSLLDDNTTYVFELKAKDKMGNTNTYQYVFSTDYTGPNVTISQKPVSPNNKIYVDFKFSCNEACETKCILQNESSIMEFKDCGGQLSIDTRTFKTPYLLSTLNYTLKIVPTDAAGNEGESVDYTWTTDMVSPIGTIIKHPPLYSNETEFEFSFSCNEASTAKCSTEKQGTSPNYTICGGGLSTDPKMYRTPTLVSATINQFSFYCTDEVGNNGMVQTYNWTSDFDAPNVSCSKLPALISKDKSFDFMCTCNEKCSAVCRIVKDTQTVGQVTQCSNLTQEKILHSVKDLLDNTTYVFEVKATDIAGNIKIFQYPWTTDHAKPNVTITKKPTSPNKKRHFEFNFVCNEACKTKCSLHNGSFSTGLEDCGGQMSISTKTFETPYLLSALNYTLTIVPTDKAGNIGDSKTLTWETDMDPPICAIVKKPALTSNATIGEFTFSCNEPSTSKCSLRKQGGSPSFVDCGGNSSVSLKSYSTPTLVTATKYVFEVYCIDIAGNKGNAQNYKFTTDFDKPICTFTKKPPANSSETNVAFSITCNEATKLSCAIKKGNNNAIDRICGETLSAVERTFITKVLQSGFMYRFTVYGTDEAENRGDAISHDWHTNIHTSLTAKLNMQVSDDPKDHDVYNKYLIKVKDPLKATKISSIRKGSLIIDYDTDADNWNHVLSMVEKGSVVVDGAIIPVQSIQLRHKEGGVVDISTLINPCVVYKEYKTCPAQAPCVADGNKNAKCSAQSIGTSSEVISLSVGIVAFFILLGATLLVIHFRKPQRKTKTENDQVNEYQGPKENIHEYQGPKENIDEYQENIWIRSWLQPRFHRSRFLDSNEFFLPYRETEKRVVH